MSPGDSLIESLHPWVAFGIMPAFAVANAGVSLSAGTVNTASWPLVLGVVVGLVAGKPVGILLASWVALRLRIAALPDDLSLRHLIVLGVVAGIGFTMSLFIASLAFSDADPLAAAKIGVFAASFGAGVLGIALGRVLLSPVQIAGADRQTK